MDPAFYVLHRCRGCGSTTLGGHEDVFHLKNRCQGFLDPLTNIERVTVVPIVTEPIAADLSGRDAR